MSCRNNRFSEFQLFVSLLEETWNDYVNTNVYKLSLWGSQRICYVAIYNAYENYLVRCVKAACGLSKCRSSQEHFKDHLKNAYGKDLLKQCWTCDDINIARVARHALSHAGGRITDDVKNLKFHPFKEMDGRINVTPFVTKGLLTVLKDATYALAERSLDKPEFDYESGSGIPN